MTNSHSLLVERNTLVVVALEPPRIVARVVGAQTLPLIAVVQTLAGPITQEAHAHTQVVVALELLWRAVAVALVARRAVALV